jgi:CDGSH iron-sulfur domain-containing protein 3
MPITIKVNTNGSLVIAAADVPSVVLTDADGTVIPLPEGKNLSLCRCGASSRKPFCDGSHKSNGFDGTCVTFVQNAG